MEEAWILAIDQGTHASRALLIDREGEVRFQTRQPVALKRRDSVRAEQSARELLASVEQVVDAALAYAAEQDAAVTAAGLATQRSTVVAWDAHSGEPLYAALSWQDRRGERQLNRFSARAGTVEKTTGLRLSPHYGVSKMSWMVESVPEVAAAASERRLMMGPLVSYLMFHLLEGSPHCYDVVNAGRTLLCDLESGEWSAELVQAGGLRTEWLPHCRPVLEHYGYLKGTTIPLRAVTGDQNAALCAAGEPRGDWIQINAGSGAFVVRSIEDRVDHAGPLLISALWSDSGETRYLLEGTVNGAGAAIGWARDRWSLPAVEEALADWPQCPSGPPLFLNAVGGLGSPWWRADIESRWLDSMEPHNDVCRLAGVVESVLFLINANVELVAQIGSPVTGVRVSGGLSRSDSWCQRLADIVALPVFRSDASEATARGVAWLAAGRPAQWQGGITVSFTPHTDAQLRQRYTRFMAAVKSATAHETDH